MRRFIAARLAQSAIIVFVVTMVAFLLIRLAPGEPFAYEDRTMSPATRALWREQFGYDKPVAEQLVRYLGNVARGNLGYSTVQRRPVRDVMADAVPRTLTIAVVGLIAALFVGVLAGVVAAAARGRWWDRLITLACTLIYSIPDFWLALILQLSFAYWIRVFPVSGIADPMIADYGSPGAVLLDRLRHLALPALTLTLIISAIIARFQRAAVVDILPSDYLRTARAKGLPERSVIGRHALRNALTPTITLLGLLIPSVLGGAFFIENVFGWRGLGLLTVESVSSLDYDVATASVIVSGVLVTLGSLIADILAAIADPRIRDA